MYTYDKAEIKQALSTEQVYELIQNFGGEPQYTSFGIISSTICHNLPGEGSRKLYYYENDGNGVFCCYTGCGATFDIFDLVKKVFKIQKGQETDLNDCVRYVANYFGMSGKVIQEDEYNTPDWQKFAEYARLESLDNNSSLITLKTYNDTILDRMNYRVRLTPWLNEGISQSVLDFNRIGFFPGGDQISIPHYDINGRFIGLRGRSLCAQEGEIFGKYRPIKAGKTLYSHPLGLNLYGIDKAKENIKIAKIAIIVEGEKSVLLSQTYFGVDNNLVVACCGSSVSNQQIQLLLSLGAQEIVIALDRQFQTIGDSEFKKLKSNLTRLHNKYKNYVRISLIFDKNMITSYKASPLDEGLDKFLKLYKERIYL